MGEHAVTESCDVAESCDGIGDCIPAGNCDCEAAATCDMAVNREATGACDAMGNRSLTEGLDAGTGGPRRAAVFFVGSKLMLDDGVALAAYDELHERYEVPENVEMFDVGCMSMDMLPYVRDCDFILTVDAVDGTDEEPGTVFRFPPEAMARAAGSRASLHDLKLADLFDAAALLGYGSEGFCVGMQVENSSPAEFAVGLTPKVHDAVPLLVETVAAELDRRGFPLTRKAKAEAEVETETSCASR